PIDYIVTCVGSHDAGITVLQDGDLTGQFFRMPFVVVIKKSHEFSVRVPDAGVARSGGPPSTIVSNDAHSVILDGHDNAVDGIFGGVIHHHKLKITKGLAEHTLNRGRQQPWPVTCRDYHADLRGSHGYCQICLMIPPVGALVPNRYRALASGFVS